MATLPLAPSVISLIVSGSPSLSESFSRTLIVTGVSSLVVDSSSFSDGDSFTEISMDAVLTAVRTASLATGSDSVAMA